jgi:type IV pilus assembly protein PilP
MSQSGPGTIMRSPVLLALVALGGMACETPPPPPPPKPPPPKVEAPAPEVTAKPTSDGSGPAFTYSYNPVGKRDPFHSPLADALASQTGGGPASVSTCNQPLCRWDLDQLKLVGIVSGMANPVAMVEDPEGIGHLMRHNSFVGKRGGRVTQIKRDEVVVTEIFKGPDGKPHPNNINLKITPAAEVTVDATDLLEGEAGD